MLSALYVIRRATATLSPDFEAYHSTLHKARTRGTDELDHLEATDEPRRSDEHEEGTLTTLEAFAALNSP